MDPATTRRILEGGEDAMKDLERISAELERFEAGASRPHTATGRRTEGRQFQAMVAQWWDCVATNLFRCGAKREIVKVQPLSTRGYARPSLYTKLANQDRVLYLPLLGSNPVRGTHIALALPSGKCDWFRTEFLVEDLVSRFPGTAAAIHRYAPKAGPYASRKYPEMYTGLTIAFDGTLVMERAGHLERKWLLEYKTAKASTRRQIDGNAHERLTYQMLTYLEVACQYPRCTFVVVANGAFSKYRNKYHVTFHMQGDRLSVYSFFEMRFVSNRLEYLELYKELKSWLLG
jgi:hypothetical protein